MISDVYWPNYRDGVFGDRTGNSGSRKIANNQYLSLSSESGSEPVSTTELKLALRVDASTEDTLIAEMGIAARKAIEQFCNRALIAQTWDLFMDSVPGSDVLTIPRQPLASVTHIKTYAVDNTASTFASASYTVDIQSTPPRVFLNSGYVWPDGLRSYKAFECRFVTAASVPEGLKTAIKRMVVYWYEKRGDEDTVTDVIPEGLRSLLVPYRMMSI